MTDAPATLPAVKTQLSITAADTSHDERLAPIVAAVNGTVAGWAYPATVGIEHPGVVQGAVMLAARLYRRRNSPAGVEAFGADGMAYVMRSDPDIAMLLGLGHFATPNVG